MKFIARNWGWLVIIAMIASFLYLAFRPVPIEVDIAQVTRGNLMVSVNAEGKTRIKERFVVSAPLAGQLLRVKFRPGDSVVQGETVLAIIVPTDPGLLDARTKAGIDARVNATEAAKLQAEENLKRAKSVHQLAQATWERVKQVRNTGVISPEDVDAAEAKERVAVNDVRAAEFAVKVAQFEREVALAARLKIQPQSITEAVQERYEIRSPVNGCVLRVFQESESVVPSGTRLLELGDPGDLEMEIDVLSTDAVKIKPSAKVIIDHWGGPHSLQGQVRLVEPSGFLKISALGVEEQRVFVIADFLDPFEKRKPLGDAFRIEARIVVSDGDAVKIPSGCLFRKGQQWGAFLARNGYARFQEITTGRSNGIETEIIEGLKEGDSVILHPTDRVKEGVRIAIR